MIAATMLRSCT